MTSWRATFSAVSSLVAYNIALVASRSSDLGIAASVTKGYVKRLSTAVVTTTSDTIASPSRVDSEVPLTACLALLSIFCAWRPSSKGIRMEIFIARLNVQLHAIGGAVTIAYRHR